MLIFFIFHTDSFTKKIKKQEKETTTMFYNKSPQFKLSTYFPAKYIKHFKKSEKLLSTLHKYNKKGCY